MITAGNALKHARLVTTVMSDTKQMNTNVDPVGRGLLLHNPDWAWCRHAVTGIMNHTLGNIVYDETVDVKDDQLQLILSPV